MQCDICGTTENVVLIEEKKIMAELCLDCQTEIANYEDEQQTQQQDLY